MRTRAASEAFKVMIVGEFKRGKSTVINAMLGDKVLPSFARPCTAIINEVMRADQRSALIYPLEADGSAGDPISDRRRGDRRLRDDRRGRRQHSEPAPAGGGALAAGACRNGRRATYGGLAGAERGAERERVTLAYLEQADALVFVVDIARPRCRAASSCSSTCTSRRAATRTCSCRRQQDQPGRGRRARGRAAGDPQAPRPLRLPPGPGVLRQCARRVERPPQGGPGAGRRVRHGGTRARAGGLLPGSAAGRRSFPARELKVPADRGAEQIERRETLLNQNVDQLRSTYERVQVPLNRLEQNRRVIVAQMEGHLRETRAEVEDAGRRFMQRVMGQVPTWAREYDLENKLGANPFKAREKMEMAVREISDHLSGRIQVAFAEWQEKELKPLLQRRVEDLERSIDDDVKQFVTRIDEIRASLTPAEAETQMLKVSDKNAAPLERLLADAVSFVLDPGTALSGGKFSLRTMLTTLLPRRSRWARWPSWSAWARWRSSRCCWAATCSAAPCS
ncbi:dynamin family protein [Yinghuangia aomiensis]